MRLPVVLALLCACASEKAPPAAPISHDKVSREALNRVTTELALPLFWRADLNQDKTLDPNELVVLWGMDATQTSHWIKDGVFTPAFEHAYHDIVARAERGITLSGTPLEETKRRQALLEELSQGRTTLVWTDFREETEAVKRFVGHILKAARHIERLHDLQTGMAQLKIDTATPESRAVLYRNQSPKCVAPRTQGNPDCNALPGQTQVWGLYPADIQSQDGFCARLQREGLMTPFSAVRNHNGKLVAVPYHQAFGEEMQAVSDALKAASQALATTDEAALRAYLDAAARAFLDNDWVPADEAWAAMNAVNSKWYLRVAPDEPYREPCSTKALFHLTFARINQASLAWQAQLDPVKNELEHMLGKLAGKPYAARKVSFHLPDFIDIVLNAGDDRSPFGATIGQSLPNFGPVANEGRGRTVAMTNYDADPDSIAQRIDNGAALLSSTADLVPSAEPLLRSVVLHEAAHNLGPAHQYRVRGKIDSDVFGGHLASMLEELKAQTAALYFVDWMADQKMISAEQARQSHTVDTVWMFGHIARGMYDASKNPRPYSQLSAIQLGFFLDEGAFAWDPQAKAANGRDAGALRIDHAKLHPAIEKLMRLVAGIKAQGDKARAEKLVKDYVDADGPRKQLLDVIRERMLRNPRASYVYAVSL